VDYGPLESDHTKLSGYYLGGMKIRTRQQVAPLPAGASVRSGHTTLFRQAVEMRFRLRNPPPLNDAPLYVELGIGLRTAGISSRSVALRLLRSATLSASTLN
jgi:hypothetical protein